MGFTKWVDEQSTAVKALLFFPIWGWIFGFLYRIFKFIETEETATLIGAILFIIPFTGFILEIVDFIFIIMEGKVNFGINGKVTDQQPKEETKDDAVDAEVTEVKEEKAEDTKAE